MQSAPTPLDGVLVLTPEVQRDERGFFVENWSRRDLSAVTGTSVDFVQDGHSGSNRGVLRGLHYQLPPHSQAKLVRVVVGSVFDVAVDLRQSSPTFGQWFGVDLSAENCKQVWIPPGLAHGFLVTSDWAEVEYTVSEYYSPRSEGAIRWDDPAIGIDWPLVSSPILSERDATAGTLRDAELFA